jgi:plasmid stabilization system protein ParE
MSRFDIRLGPKAIEDVDATVAWLADRSLDGARAWLHALDEAKEAVVLAPFSFSRSRDSRRTGRDIRDAFFKTRRGKIYRIVFLIDGEDVEVLRIRGSGQPNLRAEDL